MTIKGIVIQFLAAIIISFGNFLSGFGVTWPSYALVALQSDQSPIGDPITKVQGDFIGSLPMMGSLVSTLVSSWLSDALGKKKTDILCGLCFALSWSILATATNVTLILVSRFIIGLGMGAHLSCSVPMLSEIVQSNLRGPLTSLLILCYCLGTLASYVSGWLLSYQVVNYLSLTMSTGFVVLLCFMKETPEYLLRIGDEKGAIKSLKYYRGVSKTTQYILDEIAYLKSQSDSYAEKTAEHLELNEKKKLELGERIKTEEISAWKILCTSKPVQRATVMISLNLVLSTFAGTVAVQAYAGPLFARAAPDISPHMCSIILSLAFAFGSVVAICITDLIRRRTLMMASALGSSFFLALLASLLHWSWGPEWLIPGSVLAYCCVFQMGVANIPFVQLSESLVPKVKSLVSMIAISFLCIANFIVLVLFGPTVDIFGLAGTFLVFACISFSTAVLSYFAMKESKGASVEEIMGMYAEGYFNRRK